MAAVIDAAMKTPSTAEHLKGMGTEPIGGTRASFTKFVDEERARLGGVVKATGMKEDWPRWAVAGMQRALTCTAQRLVGKPLLDELEEKYAN
ncbi:hypothetical protein [Variovorax sp. W1I1]